MSSILQSFSGTIDGGLFGARTGNASLPDPEHPFTIPGGKKYARASIKVTPKPPLGEQFDRASYGASIQSEPQAGDTGSQKIIVHGFAGPFGSTDYVVDVFVDEVEQQANPPKDGNGGQVSDPGKPKDHGSGCNGGGCCCEVAVTAIAQITATAKMSGDLSTIALTQTVAMTKMTTDVLLAIALQMQSSSKKTDELFNTVISHLAKENPMLK